MHLHLNPIHPDGIYPFNGLAYASDETHAALAINFADHTVTFEFSDRERLVRFCNQVVANIKHIAQIWDEDKLFIYNHRTWLQPQYFGDDNPSYIGFSIDKDQDAEHLIMFIGNGYDSLQATLTPSELSDIMDFVDEFQEVTWNPAQAAD